MPPKIAKPATRRAKQERARETVAVVLEAAAQVLAREGYARATTNRIAEAEGVAMNASAEFFGGRGAEELATLFTRYLTASGGALR